MPNTCLDGACGNTLNRNASDFWDSCLLVGFIPFVFAEQLQFPNSIKI